MINLTTKTVLRVDTAEVSRAVGAANARALNKAGGRIRKIARNSIPFRKRRTTTSKPNKPPNAHRRGKGIKTILYGYDRRSHSLVVGFAKLGGVSGDDVPRTLEAGGTARIKTQAPAPRRRRKRKGQRQRSTTERAAIRRYYQNKRATRKTKTVRIAKRPTMFPALQKEAPTLAGLWDGEVKPTALF
ncbi:hypothetical protein U8335_04075 [Roseiconus lacunae]|uniref:hypothetical protein n=1 Tax=Roseiconus lacunae TaxID=2605694 RepID=UPI00308EF27B|nr:hypothetical protein U8335_04075 [Stieleria sp. HD01]